LAKLLKSIGSLDGVVQLSGGLALDEGLVVALKAALVKEKVTVPVESHPDAIYAGAIGAALWGAFRHEKLRQIAEQAHAA
jgi:benzoyl-CoA reductase subunit D